MDGLDFLRQLSTNLACLPSLWQAILLTQRKKNSLISLAMAEPLLLTNPRKFLQVPSMDSIQIKEDLFSWWSIIFWKVNHQLLWMNSLVLIEIQVLWIVTNVLIWHWFWDISLLWCCWWWISCYFDKIVSKSLKFQSRVYGQNLGVFVFGLQWTWLWYMLWFWVCICWLYGQFYEIIKKTLKSFKLGFIGENLGLFDFEFQWMWFGHMWCLW